MLSDEEFNELLEEKKVFIEKDNIIINVNNDKIVRNIKSVNDNNEFILNIRRGKIELSKMNFQTREKETNTIMLRLDLASGGRHFNPDGKLVLCPHIHIYKDGYGDKWAYELDDKLFSNIESKTQVLQDFLKMFNVEEIPLILIEETFI